MPPEKAVEAIIQEAQARGEFDNLPGSGKPLDLSTYFDTPEEVRLAYSILKNAGILPREAELLKEIAALKNELDLCTEIPGKEKLRKEIRDKLLSFNTLSEQRKGR